MIFNLLYFFCFHIRVLCLFHPYYSCYVLIPAPTPLNMLSPEKLNMFLSLTCFTLGFFHTRWEAFLNLSYDLHPSGTFFTVLHQMFHLFDTDAACFILQ